MMTNVAKSADRGRGALENAALTDMISNSW